jgi:hypothetical protein
MGKDKTCKMKKIKVRCREGIPDSFMIDQMYGVLTEDNDIHVNGSVEMVGTDYGNIKRIKVYANLCNKDGAILYVLNGWKNFPVSKGAYNSFSLYCSTVGRFFDPEELDYVELYLTFNEKDS